MPSDFRLLIETLVFISVVYLITPHLFPSSEDFAMSPKKNGGGGSDGSGGKKGGYNDDKKENQPSSSSGGYGDSKTTDETIALLLQMMEDLNIDETSADQMKEMEDGLKSLQSKFKAKNKVVKTEEQKIAEAKERNAKYAKARKEKTAAGREAVLNLTVRYNGVSHNIVLRGKHGIGRIRSSLAEILNIKKDTKFILTLGNVVLSDLDPTKTLRLAGVRDGDIIDAVLAPSTAAGATDASANDEEEHQIPATTIAGNRNIDDDISDEDDERDDDDTESDDDDLKEL